ncbi:zinc finger protein Xfin-like isoform X1 [Macrobrachium nipponense]|uniref:zinc finger protein Xfin-like isoform X1 n=2 Tax=Macrobrachium nipponense TaxID=159736 RepID=UPI0030C8253E
METEMDETLIRKRRAGVESSPRTSSEEKHQKVRIKKEFECDVCGRTYSWEQSLIRHQKSTKHLSGRSQSSVSLGRELRHNFNNRLHKNTEASKRHVNSSANKAKGNRKVCKNPYACDICGKVFSFKNYVAVHRRLHLNLKPYKCSICGKEYGLPSSYKNHVKGHKNTNIRKRFSKPPATGMSNQQKTVRPKVQNPCACDICGKVFSNKNYVHCHKRIHYGLKPFKCTLCKMEFRYKSNYNKHLKEQCDASEEQCSVSSLAENLNDQDKEDSQVLQLRSSDSHNMTSHAKLHSGPSVTRSPANLPAKSLNSESNTLPCKLCDKTFSRKAPLLVHMRTHAGAMPFTCTVCNIKFRVAACTICSMKFRVAFNYRKHIEEMHPNIIKSREVGKKVVGLLCSYCFKAPSRLDPVRHSKSHRRYGCKKCKKDFALKTDMVMHMKAAHDVKEKLDESDQPEDGINESNEHSPKYNEENRNVNGCEVCQKTFPDAAALKKHKAAVHVEGKPHVCDVCHRVFGMKVNLARHYTTHTRGRRVALTSGVKLKQSSSRTMRRVLNRCKACKISFTSPSEYLKHRIMHFKLGPHECQDCKVDFKNPKDFGDHMKNVHRSSKPFICNKCGMECFLYVNLVRHILVSHENFKMNPLHNRTSMAKFSFNNHGKRSDRQNRNHTLGKENTLENNQLPSEQPPIEIDDLSNTASTWKSKTDIHKFPDIQESKPHVCALCKSVFTTYYFLKVHMTRVHANVGGVTLRKKREPCRVSPKFVHAFECSLCKERFPSRYLRSKHMRTNHETITTSIWIHTCMKCKQMFMEKGVYVEHLEICQSKSDVNCRNEDTFGNIINSVAKLAEGQNTKPKGNIISQEKEYNGKNKLHKTGAKPDLLGNENVEDSPGGNVLPEDFADESPETESQKFHKDDEKKVNECLVCRKQFTRRDLLSEHLKVTHNISHLLFTCIRCKQLFSKRSSFKEHIKICRNESAMNLVIEENTIKIVGPEIEVTDHRQNTELGGSKTSQTREREENLRYQETDNGEQELIENAEVQANKITAAQGALNENGAKVAKHNKTSKMEVNDKQSGPQETKDEEQELLHKNEESEFQANKSEDLPERVFTEDEQPVVLDFPEIPKSQEIECTEYESLSLSGDYEHFSSDNENFSDDNQSGGLRSDDDDDDDIDDSESNALPVTEKGGTLKNDKGVTVTKSTEVETVNDQTDTSGSGIDNFNNTSLETTLEEGECLKSKERTRQLSFECGNRISTSGQTSDKCETEIESEIAERASTASHNNSEPSEPKECDDNAPEQNLHIYSQSDTDIIDESLVVPEGEESTAKESCDVSKRRKHSYKCDTVKPEMCDFVANANCSGYQLFRRSVEMNCLATHNESQDVPKYVVIRNVNVAYASFYEAKVVSGWMKY